MHTEVQLEFLKKEATSGSNINSQKDV